MQVLIPVFAYKFFKQLVCKIPLQQTANKQPTNITYKHTQWLAKAESEAQEERG